MRVVHVIGRLAVGGAERHFVNLLNAMEGAERHAVLISPPAEGPALDNQLSPDVELHHCRVSRRRAPLDVFRLASLFRRLGPDVVHAHMFWASLYASVAARSVAVPAVFTTEHGENRWKKPYHRWLERRVISPLTTQRFCVSPQILATRRDRDRVPAGKLALVANGVPLPDLNRRRPPAVATIGSVGRFVPQKDFPSLVKAAALLRDRGYDFRLVLIGDGPERGAIEAAVERTGLGERVRLTGFRESVDDDLRRLSVFASSSVQEGQPLALLEAMAWGLPSVATDVGAVAATLTSGEEGVVVAPGKPAELADALAAYLEDGGLARVHGRAARQRVERDFSSAAVARRHLETYAAWLGRNGQKADGTATT